MVYLGYKGEYRLGKHFILSKRRTEEGHNSFIILYPHKSKKGQLQGPFLMVRDMRDLGIF